MGVRIKRISHLFVLMSILLVSTACLKTTINLDDVLTNLTNQGVALSEAKDVHPNNVFIKSLNDVKPSVYMTDRDQMLSIYIYKTERGVEKGIQDFEEKTATADVVSHTQYEIHNVLIFYTSEVGVDQRVQAAVDELKNM